MKLIFPNLQNEEGKTICQLFAVDFLKYLENNGIKLKMVDLNNMVAELEDTIDLDENFNNYLNKVFEEGLLSYNYTSKLIGRGKVDIAKKVGDPNKISEFTKKIFEPSGAEVVFEDMGEKLFAGHIEALHSISTDIESHRCVQSGDEKGNVCNVCGLVGGNKSDVTERISLVADKCWKPLGQYEQLKGCRRCAYVLGLISNMRFLWRVNISGKNGKTRFSVVPKFVINTTKPTIIDKIIESSTYFGLFRTSFRGIGTTSLDFILNSFKDQPIITKIVADGEVMNLMVYIQSATGQGGFVTENVIGSQKIQQIAKFVEFLNKYFPKLPYANRGEQVGTDPRIISDTAYIWTTKGKSAAMCHFFTKIKKINIDFDVLLKILGGKKMKIEYFRNKEEIQKMNEYEWDNPLVRISTFFVAETAYQAKKDNKKPEQAINSSMALFNSIHENEKTKTVRKYLEEITNNGNSHIISRINKPEEFISEFSKAFNECNIKQLKEIVRYMRIFANTYRYKKSEEKDAILAKTIEELGYSLKSQEEKV